MLISGLGYCCHMPVLLICLWSMMLLICLFSCFSFAKFLSALSMELSMMDCDLSVVTLAKQRLNCSLVSWRLWFIFGKAAGICSFFPWTDGSQG